MKDSTKLELKALESVLGRYGNVEVSTHRKQYTWGATFYVDVQLPVENHAHIFRGIGDNFKDAYADLRKILSGGDFPSRKRPLPRFCTAKELKMKLELEGS